jgi:hypothetical protein
VLTATALVAIGVYQDVDLPPTTLVGPNVGPVFNETDDGSRPGIGHNGGPSLDDDDTQEATPPVTGSESSSQSNNQNDDEEGDNDDHNPNNQPPRLPPGALDGAGDDDQNGDGNDSRDAVVPSRALDDLIGDLTPLPGTGGKTTQYQKSGGFEQANADFDALGLSNVKAISIPGGGTGRVGQLPDGRNVVVRPSSSDRIDGHISQPTLEIQNPGGYKTKFRY